MDTKEKGAAVNDAPKKASKEIVATGDSRVNMEIAIHGRHLPYCAKPRSVYEAKAKINSATKDMEKTIEDYVFRMGIWFAFIQETLPYGQFTKWLPKNTRFKYRTAKNYMDYAVECRIGGRMKPYHPNPKAGVQPETKALLDSPEDSSATVAEVGAKKFPTVKSEKHKPAWTRERAVAEVVEQADRVSCHCDREELASFELLLTEALTEYFKGRRMLEGGEDS